MDGSHDRQGISRHGRLGRRVQVQARADHQRPLPGHDATHREPLSVARKARAHTSHPPGPATDVDFPSWMIESLDREAKRLGVTRQSITKVWIAERLDPKVS